MLNAFHDWFKTAKRGDRFAYHRGDLAFDRYVPLGKEVPPEKREMAIVADMAHEYYFQRDLILVQRKHGKNDYEYIAVKI